MKRVFATALAIVLALTQFSPAQAHSQSDQLRPIGVRILSGSKINLVAHESKLPIAITNDFDTPVRVILHVRPKTLQVTMPESVSVEIPPQTTVNAKIPITATADGDVTIDTWLTTFSGLKFGRVVKLQVSVNEDVELYLVLSFAVLLSLLILIGVLRTLRRKRADSESMK